MGGVDSPVRSFGAVGGHPVVFARGKGPHLWDVDGHRYIDLVGSWGANLLGNAADGVVRAVERTARNGLSFGAPSPLESELAERIRRSVPGLDRLRFVNSGTEAVMSAVRTARGFTGRPKVLKFAGGYHGHSDGLLARAGSGLATQSIADSAGVPEGIVAETLVCPYNDLDAVRRTFEAHPEAVAAIVVEPVAANMNLVLPEPGFLPGIERLCRAHGSLLIADEVITGFRLRRGAFHTSMGAQADLVTFGKIIGGGLPIGAYGGRAEVMRAVAPEGPVYQAGTLSGNPVVMAAGTATLDALSPSLYRGLERAGASIAKGWVETAEEAGAGRFHLTRLGSMMGLFFGEGRPHNYEEAMTVDRSRYARFFHAMLDAGVYLPPSPLETTFVSASVGPSEIGALRKAGAVAFPAAC